MGNWTSAGMHPDDPRITWRDDAARAEAAEQRYDRLAAGVREMCEWIKSTPLTDAEAYLAGALLEKLEALLADDGEAGR